MSASVSTVRWIFFFFLSVGNFLKQFLLSDEKNTFLKKLLAALACAFFKSVFFCGLVLYSA